MKLSLHDPALPIPEGKRPFVALELGDAPVSAPSLTAKQEKPIPHDDVIANIRWNTVGRRLMQPGDFRAEGRRMVLAGYGPSLLDTWESLIGPTPEGTDLWTCSGALKFLTSRGIVPTWHTECDPRKHKARFLLNPHYSVRYLLASRVHPHMLENVAGCHMDLFHMDIKSERDVCLELSPGAALVPTGTTNGMSALSLGLYLGYRDFVVHGMDGSFNCEEHAGPHPNSHEHAWSEVEVYGRRFHTSMLHMLALQDFFTLALSHPDATFTFVGDGMIPWAVEESKRLWRKAHPQ